MLLLGITSIIRRKVDVVYVEDFLATRTPYRLNLSSVVWILSEHLLSDSCNDPYVESANSCFLSKCDISYRDVELVFDGVIFLFFKLLLGILSNDLIILLACSKEKIKTGSLVYYFVSLGALSGSGSVTLFEAPDSKKKENQVKDDGESEQPRPHQAGIPPNVMKPSLWFKVMPLTAYPHTLQYSDPTSSTA
ncbi:hypothetical protein Tco_0199331 [Tanacetum coccineum]